MLEGIRVLDLSRVIAGPYCAMMLADLGADVVKVERPGRGDDMRYLGHGKDGMSLGFATINRNKRAIAVDLQHPEGLKIVVELARRSDVVLENFVPGVADWNIICEMISETLPGLLAKLKAWPATPPKLGPS